VSGLAKIKAGEVAAIYVLYGSEHALMRGWVEAIRAAVLDPAFAAFNHERFVGRDLEGPGKVVDACMQIPVMAKRRLVELDEPEAIGKSKASANPKLLDTLVAYLAAPNPSTVLVVTSAGIDARSRLVTAAKKSGVVEKFEGLRRNDEAVGFIAAHAREVGIGLEPGAANALVERVGTSPSALAQALEQTSVFAGVGVRVTAQHVAAVITDAREAVVFDLTDAVGMGRHEAAIAVLRRIFAQGDSAVGEATALVGMLARQLRLLLLVHGVGLRQPEVERTAGVPPFVARKLVDQARRFAPDRLRRAFASLVRFDGDLKGGSYVVQRSPELALERWILESCDALPKVARR
jgi:DNA polymerase-3 subunit delta